jgi:GMP synthase PP-ATPase subunit
LFDRDTLFVHQYKINFLYVLKSYTQFGNQAIEKFRKETKAIFRDNFVEFFSNKDKSKFELYEYQQTNIDDFIETNFRLVNGKCFKTIDNKLILAKYDNDNSLDTLLNDFKPFELT